MDFLFRVQVTRVNSNLAKVCEPVRLNLRKVDGEKSKAAVSDSRLFEIYSSGSTSSTDFSAFDVLRL